MCRMFFNILKYTVLSNKNLLIEKWIPFYFYSKTILHNSKKMQKVGADIIDFLRHNGHNHMPPCTILLPSSNVCRSITPLAKQGGGANGICSVCIESKLL